MQAQKILNNFSCEGETLVSPFDYKLQYEGRIDFEREDGAVWVFPATCVRIRFFGKYLKAVVTNIHAYWENSLGWILDGTEFKGILSQEISPRNRIVLCCLLQMLLVSFIWDMH